VFLKLARLELSEEPGGAQQEGKQEMAHDGRLVGVI
jgi:hypothetical protein